MTVLEQKFLETVPLYLRGILESLKEIASLLKDKSA